MVQINLRHAVCIRRQNAYALFPFHRHNLKYPFECHQIVLQFACDTHPRFQPQKNRFECRSETVYHLRA